MCRDLGRAAEWDGVGRDSRTRDGVQWRPVDEPGPVAQAPLTRHGQRRGGGGAIPVYRGLRVAASCTLVVSVAEIRGHGQPQLRDGENVTWS